MMILLLFNEKVEHSYEEISDRMQVEERELKRQLQSLACGKHKVLVKVPKGREVNPGDTFKHNTAFTSKLYKVKIGTVSAQKESAKQQVETKSKVEDDRKHQIEAAIVRVMKSRNVLQHNNLITEVIKQLSGRFTPNTQFIKKRIESLIERDFLERSKDDMRQYHYLA